MRTPSSASSTRGWLPVALVGLAAIVAGCATYYQKSAAFQQHFVKGEFREAAAELERDPGASTGKSRLLYFLQQGTVQQLLEEYESSNEAFESAYFFTQDLRRNYPAEMFSLLSNPMTLPYRGEDFERVQIHYFKAVNYLLLDRPDEALVECRRIGIELDRLDDQYGGRNSRYRRDAFALNIMGIVYDAAGDDNNAFIAYRNAYDAYREGYARQFDVKAPRQLKLDLLGAARRSGLAEEAEQYEKEFGFGPSERAPGQGDVVLLWHNGLGPVKGEWSLNFFLVRGAGGIVTFVNEDLGVSIPFPLGSGGDASTLSDLKFVRVAFPRYLERKPYYRTAEAIVAGRSVPLERTQDLNAIAFKSLEDRMLRELGTSLLRLAIKQATERTLRGKNENLGALLSVANALTEKVDTRNWQTLPHAISYARIRLPAGTHRVQLRAISPHGSNSENRSLEVAVEEGKTVFALVHSLTSIPLEPHP